jgi:hypothetical protein
MPAGAGLGVELRDDAVSRYAMDPRGGRA